MSTGLDTMQEMLPRFSPGERAQLPQCITRDLGYIRQPFSPDKPALTGRASNIELLRFTRLHAIDRDPSK
jgi:hypothetical protein